MDVMPAKWKQYRWTVDKLEIGTDRCKQKKFWIQKWDAIDTNMMINKRILKLKENANEYSQSNSKVNL